MKAAAVVAALCGLAACDMITTEEWANMDLDKITTSIPDCYISCKKADYDNFCKGTKFEGLDYKDVAHILTLCRRLDNKDKPISEGDLQEANTKLTERFAKAPLPGDASSIASKTSSGGKPTETTKASEDKKNAAADSGSHLGAAVAMAAAVAVAAI
ncbi:hypothetical protein NLG97_g2723 [Lecanicillium saksenae]|uniref:Uncharacterized protein n=1 Tax=Lecanicillium saksenae TaxID=468837 RepID=A0ACC1R038_9HYPO|nr:hypothetical protein NLG97_g2723 [Lecanicillium saksenae]